MTSFTLSHDMSQFCLAVTHHVKLHLVQIDLVDRRRVVCAPTASDYGGQFTISPLRAGFEGFGPLLICVAASGIRSRLLVAVCPTAKHSNTFRTFHSTAWFGNANSPKVTRSPIPPKVIPFQVRVQSAAKHPTPGSVSEAPMTPLKPFPELALSAPRPRPEKYTKTSKKSARLQPGRSLAAKPVADSAAGPPRPNKRTCSQDPATQP